LSKGYKVRFAVMNRNWYTRTWSAILAAIFYIYLGCPPGASKETVVVVLLHTRCPFWHPTTSVTAL